MVSCRGVLRGFGKGVLELSGGTLFFYTRKGLLRKKRIIVREISLLDIIDMKYSASELTIKWRSQDTVEDVFIADGRQLEALKGLAIALEESLREYERREKEKAEMERRRREELQKKAEEQREKLVQIFVYAAKIVDALFGILRSLESRTKWDDAEEYLESSMKNIKALQRDVPALSLDFTKLSLAVRGHYRQETIDETYNILSQLYDHFVNTPFIEEDEEIKNIHPNLQDMRTLISAYYMINDIILGVMVEDENIQDEIDHFLELMEKAKNVEALKIDIDEIREALNRLLIEGEKESIIKKLKNLLLVSAS